ncbi:MAG: DUF433 domain-containing protein [Deltaproteobacteria bacterium]|nr:DUF433 domain-containing protein [Deltaproteobacteria bacterium]
MRRAHYFRSENLWWPLTFKGTRVLVKDVLSYVAQGKRWKWISQAYDGRLTRQVIAEAVDLAREALVARTEKRRRAA